MYGTSSTWVCAKDFPFSLTRVANLVQNFYLPWNGLPSLAHQVWKTTKKWEREENQIKTNSFNQKQSILYKGFTFSTKKTQERKIQPASILITNLVFFPHISHLSFIPKG